MRGRCWKLFWLREPLTFDLIKDMTGLDQHYALPETLVGLSTLVGQANGRYSLFHKSLADWLSGNKSKYRVSLQAGDQCVWAFVSQELRDSPTEWSNYTLRWGLCHLQAAQSFVKREPSSGMHQYELRWQEINKDRRFHRE